VQDEGSHPHEAASLRLDASKASRQLGWRPRLAVTEALDWVVDWYGRYFRGADAKALYLEQIGQYEGKVPAHAAPAA
jgi:CDP-glucose 4,6-dehydratase